MNKFLFFLVFFSINVFSQTDSLNTGKYYTAKQVFDKDYKIQKFSKISKSQIKVENNKVIFSGLKSIEYAKNSDIKTKLILESGLLNPSYINQNYNIKISFLEELPLLNPNLQTKRFRFWISNYGNKNPLLNSVNPTEYYFELQNDIATDRTSFEDFVKGGKLTFLKYGGIIL
ncbi:hypothetical protein [Halpernia sp.]|uniref:hypothetical protein n=1 Tax=Halpernia sp. TaxID=2782209 RepID=UPI003A8DA57C